MRKALFNALSVATAVVVLGCYGLADTLDLVPGPLTAAGVPVVAEPFPTPSFPGAEPAQAPVGLADDAPVPDGAAVKALAEQMQSDPSFEGAQVGVSVIDVASGQELVDLGAGAPLTPASSIKLLTAWAALSLLGGDHTLATTTTLSGTTVTLVGGGDVLLAQDAGDPQAVAGRAGLGDLARSTAEALKSQGVTTVSVALDDTLFTGPDWHSAWKPGTEAYVARVQPLMVDISSRPFGSYPADPAMEAAQVFAAHLAEAGVVVEGVPARAASAPEAVELARVSSAPLADVLSVSLKKSNNTMTEVEARLVALASGGQPSFKGATEAVREQVSAQGFDVSGVVMDDACGLSSQDKVPARLLARMVARAAGPEGGDLGRTLLADLPVAALEGTMHDHFLGTSGAGVVRAKTGSLEDCSSLSGVVPTSSGRLLAFSVVVHGFKPGQLWNVRQVVDSGFVTPLAEM